VTRAGSAPTVGLAMIVKNEALTLPRLAASLQGQLDHWTIVDTGSTDDTVAISHDLFAGIPGEVIRAEWRGYGPSRNVALAAARPHTDWVLTLDADDTFHGAIACDVPSEFDGIEAEYHVGRLRYWVPRLVRSNTEWTWRGRAHEYLARSEGAFNLYRATSFYVEHHADGGNRGDKFERELTLLLEDHRENPHDDRTAFYLGRAYDDAGDPAQAADWYRTRLDLGGWVEETFYATWRLGVCLLALGQIDEGCGVLWRAWGDRPWRAEPLWSLAEHYRTSGQWQLGFEACAVARRQCGIEADVPGNGFGGDRLFVHADVYEWRISYELSICAYYVDERALGMEMINRLMARTDLPPDIAANVRNNRTFYVDGA
jgi:glycosyltransferase involved in cell wall biosynthesis